MPLLEWLAAVANIEVLQLAFDATRIAAAGVAGAAPARDLGEQRIAPEVAPLVRTPNYFR